MTQKIQNLKDYNAKNALVLSIGMFDGVHLGHQSIIKLLNRIAKEKLYDSAILSFWPHPRSIFNPNENIELLQILPEKVKLMRELGVNHFIVSEFDEQFRNLSPEDFVKKILIKKLNVKYLIVGYDHRFGKDKKGDFTLLKKMGLELGFDVLEQNAISIENENISSTKIRNSLFEGNMEKASRLLGRDFTWQGKVIKGEQLGRKIGFPTANIEIDVHKIQPKNGAYIVEVLINKEIYNGMLNIGKRPTVNGLQTQMEVHILDFNQDIYGKEIEIIFKSFLREEQKFESLDKLIQQLDKDKITVEKYFNAIK